MSVCSSVCLKLMNVIQRVTKFLILFKDLRPNVLSQNFIVALKQNFIPKDRHTSLYFLF